MPNYIRLATVASAGYPVVLPSIKDARLHLAAVIVSLQILGQVAFGFDLSIAQILISIGVCAILELAIVFRQQRIISVEIWLVSGAQDMTPVVRLLPQGAKIKLVLAKNGHFFIPRDGA